MVIRKKEGKTRRYDDVKTMLSIIGASVLFFTVVILVG